MPIYSSTHRTVRAAVALMLLLPALAAAQTAKSRDWVPQDAAKARMEKGADGTRIFGGKPVTLAANPWQVALLYASDPNTARAQHCGGVVIGQRWVLTAAHCVDRSTGPAEIEVLGGTANLKGGGRRFKVDRILIHEDWTREKFQPDIALLRVVVVQGTTIGTAIELHTDPMLDIAPPSGDIVLITGWGVTENRQDGTEELQGVSIPIVKRSACQKTVVYGTRINENVFCAGAPEKDTCSGDSGGPATMVAGGTRKLIGLTSWGDGCGLTDKPGVYTNVARFVDWKDSVIAANGGL